VFPAYSCDACNCKDVFNTWTHVKNICNYLLTIVSLHLQLSARDACNKKNVWKGLARATCMYGVWYVWWSTCMYGGSLVDSEHKVHTPTFFLNYCQEVLERGCVASSK
jgi:hypothetical protein